MDEDEEEGPDIRFVGWVSVVFISGWGVGMSLKMNKLGGGDKNQLKLGGPQAEGILAPPPPILKAGGIGPFPD